MNSNALIVYYSFSVIVPVWRILADAKSPGKFDFVRGIVQKAR